MTLRVSGTNVLAASAPLQTPNMQGAADGEGIQKFHKPRESCKQGSEQETEERRGEFPNREEKRQETTKEKQESHERSHNAGTVTVFADMAREGREKRHLHGLLSPKGEQWLVLGW